MKYITIKIISLLLTLSIINSCTAQKTKLSFRQKTKIKIKLNKGKKRIFERDYREALNIYREILSIDNTHAKANFRVGVCQFYIGKFSTALKYVKKAYLLDSTADKEMHYMLGLTNHRMGNLEKAKKHYSLFKEASSKRTIRDYYLNNLIAQCDYAKKSMENPVNVTVEHLGKNINTLNPEYSASVSADGKTMVFTSRRSDTKGGRVDEESDNLYYEDIYITYFDESSNEWSEAVSIPGKANTDFHDAVLNISPDGSYILVYKNDPDETKSGDIYISKRKEATDTTEMKYGKPKSIEKGSNVNSSYFESSASVTSDGNTMYFVSDREGGKGGADIYMSLKTGSKSWSKAVNMGDSINTELDEKCVFIHPNGQTLFFTSQGHDNLGGYDIFVSYKREGTWSKAINLGYPINTVKEEKTFSITGDGKAAYISAEYKNSYGGSDIYKVDLSKLNILKK